MRVLRILLYPVKSLDPVEVKEAKITEKGSLKNDRLFYLVDEEGKIVNAKKEKKLHKIRCETDLETQKFTLRVNGETYELSFSELDKLSEILSDFLGYRVFLKREETGMPDDKKAHGPTLMSDKTVEEIGRWFNLPFEEVLLRFRPNILVSAKEPFEEEKLLWKEFYVGKVLLRAENISKRCPVPTRNPFTGEEYKDFVKIFIKKRKENLPSWLSEEAFGGNFYRVALNTNVLEGFGEVIRVADEVKPAS
ncbi:MOSC domain-containing protein [Aquifex sp.]